MLPVIVEFARLKVQKNFKRDYELCFKDYKLCCMNEKIIFALK